MYYVISTIVLNYKLYVKRPRNLLSGMWLVRYGNRLPVDVTN